MGLLLPLERVGYERRSHIRFDCSLAGRGAAEGEAAVWMILHVPHPPHGLDLGLDGAELVVVSVIAALKQVLVAPVPGVLVTHPSMRQRGESGRQREKWGEGSHMRHRKKWFTASRETLSMYSCVSGNQNWTRVIQRCPSEKMFKGRHFT